MKLISDSLDYTEMLGMEIGRHLLAGDVIGLRGDLGAGKTTLAKAIGKGLGVEDLITSPTFTIIREYEGRLPYYHFDTYRLENLQEDDMDLDSYLFGEGVCVIEWADVIKDFLPKDMLWINMTYAGDRVREIEFEGQGEHWTQRVKEWFGQ